MCAEVVFFSFLTRHHGGGACRAYKVRCVDRCYTDIYEQPTTDAYQPEKYIQRGFVRRKCKQTAYETHLLSTYATWKAT